MTEYGGRRSVIRYPLSVRQSSTQGRKGAEAQGGKAAAKEGGRWRIENGRKPLVRYDCHMVCPESVAKKKTLLGIALQGPDLSF